MGLTFQSTQSNSRKDMYQITKKEEQHIVALAGNPNTGKSSVFNSLTGLHQHTGNWPGKTVVNARGEFKYKENEYILVDLPGTYSLFTSSAEESVARDFICFGNSEAVIVVCDATCLERNLNLAYQIIEVTHRVILCINLMDEAEKKHIKIDAAGLEKELGIPVVLCSARKGFGLDSLKEKLHQLIYGEITPTPKQLRYSDTIENQIAGLEPAFLHSGMNSRWLALRYLDTDLEQMALPIQLTTKELLSSDQINTIIHTSEIVAQKSSLRDEIAGYMYQEIETVTNKYVSQDNLKHLRDLKIDKVITSRLFGIPLMAMLLAFIFWITISGANIPSALLSNLFSYIEGQLTLLFQNLNTPAWLHGLLILGLFRTISWVISVMLPPMAIFFPLFTLLEDLGYLPRVAFNLDHLFKKACAHGKQCLTMCIRKPKL